MATDDKARAKKDELLGKAKEKYAEAVDDERWQREGRAQQRKGALKQAGDKLREAFRR